MSAARAAHYSTVRAGRPTAPRPQLELAQAESAMSMTYIFYAIGVIVVILVVLKVLGLY